MSFNPDPSHRRDTGDVCVDVERRIAPILGLPVVFDIHSPDGLRSIGARGPAPMPLPCAIPYRDPATGKTMILTDCGPALVPEVSR